MTEIITMISIPQEMLKGILQIDTKGLYDNQKPYEDIKISNESKYMIIVILVYKSTFNFLQDLKDKCMKILINPCYQVHKG